MSNLKTKRALKSYIKNPGRGVKLLSKREKLKRKRKKNYAKNLNKEFHVGAFNNVYNMTSNIFPIKNHLQKYDDIAKTYSIIAHNFDMYGQDSTEDVFKKQHRYGVEKQRLGFPTKKFISRKVASGETQIFLKPIVKRKRLKNENVPDAKKTMKQMEKKIIERKKKYAAFLRKQKAKRSRRKGRRRRRGRFGKLKKRGRRGRRRRRGRRLVDSFGNNKSRKLSLKKTKKNSSLDMIDQILNGSITQDDSIGNISDIEFGAKSNTSPIKLETTIQQTQPETILDNNNTKLV